MAKFPVGRVHRRLTTRTKGRVGALAAVFTAAVLEYLAREVLMHAGKAANNMREKRIIPPNIRLAVQGNKDLHSLIKIIADSGLSPRTKTEKNNKSKNRV